MSEHLFLSPHYDDAVGSCAGAIQRFRAAGDAVRVLTLFGGGGGEPLSPFARRLHHDWGLEDPVPRRRAENADACEILDCGQDAFDFPDAIYRRDDGGAFLYENLEDLTDEPASSDAGLPRRIADAIAGRHSKTGGTIYCPLSIGNHVDHVVARRCGETLLSEGWSVVFYQDFFYDRQSAPSRFAETDQRYARATISLSRREIETAYAAISAYRSQIPALFGSARKLKLYYLKHRRKETYYFPPQADPEAFRRSVPTPGGVGEEWATYLKCVADRILLRLAV